MKLRAEKVERSFAHVLDRGGMRRAHLRGQENVQKGSLPHVAGLHLPPVMRQIFGYGAPTGFADGQNTLFVLFFEVNFALGYAPPHFSVIIIIPPANS